MSGWIKIHRSITDHWLYKENRVYSKLEAWYDLLLNVNYIDAKTIIKGKLYEVKRGQSIMSLESWGKRWNWDKSKVRRFLNLLQNDSMIELISDNITTQLTICNYYSYQAERNADETQTKHKRNTDEIQTKPIKESKEIKNIIIRKQEFAASLQPYLDLYGKDMLNEFYAYWTEHGDNDRKMRFEKEKAFGVERRLINWDKNKNKFGNFNDDTEPKELQILKRYAKK